MKYQKLEFKIKHRINEMSDGKFCYQIAYGTDPDGEAKMVTSEQTFNTEQEADDAANNHREQILKVAREATESVGGIVGPYYSSDGHGDQLH